MPLTGNVAWARKFGSENMSSSLTTKRRKVSSGSCTVKVIGSAAFHAGLRPLSPAAGRKDRTPSHSRHHRARSSLHCPVSTASLGPLLPRPSLTIDDGLALLVCVATQLHLHERTGDAAGGLGKVSGGENLRRTNCYRENIWRFSVASGSVPDVPYLDVQVILDALLLLLRVVVVLAHELRLQHVARASVQTEEGAVQLGVFI